MNFFNLSGNKNECWQNVSGTARAFYAKISAGLRRFTTAVCEKSRSVESQLHNDVLYREIYSSLLDYHPLLQRAPQFILGRRLWSMVEFWLTSTCLLTYLLCCTENRLRNHVLIPIRKSTILRETVKCCVLFYDELLSKRYFGFILLTFYGSSILHFTGWPLWVNNLFCLFSLYSYFHIAYLDRYCLISQSEKEYSLSKRVFREQAQKKQYIRDLKKLLKTSQPEKRKRLTKKIEKLESHAEISLNKWTAARELIMTQCTDPGMRKFFIASLLCCVSVYNSANSIGVISSVMQFVNSEFAGNESHIMELWYKLMELNGTVGVPLEDYQQLESHSMKTDDVIHSLRSMNANWTLFKNGPAYTRFHEFLCTLVAFGLLKGDTYDVSLGNIKLFSMDTRRESMSATDALDAVVKLVTYLTESGIYAFANKSLKPFLFDDKAAYEIEEEYARLGPMVNHVNTGNLELLYKMNSQDLEGALWALERKIGLVAMTTKGMGHTLLERKREQVIRWMDTVCESQIACGTREAPYAPVLIGDSNIGKTTLTQLFGRELGARFGFKSSARYQCVIQGNDKFWTGYKGYTQIAILDDFGNTDPKYMTEDEGSKQIMIKNNQILYAPKAGVEEKGRVPVQPKVLIVNTNNETMLSEMSVCPYSRYRRGDIYIRAEVRDEFSRYVDGVRQNEIDTERVKLTLPKNEEGDYIFSTMPDLWEIQLTKPYQSSARVKSSNVKKSFPMVSFMPVVKDKNGKPAKLSIFDALDATCDQARKFYETQKSTVDVSRRMDIDFVPCECGCKKSKAFCNALKLKVPEKGTIAVLPPILESHGLLEYSTYHLASIIWKYYTTTRTKFFDLFFDIEKNILNVSTTWLIANYRQMYYDSLFDLTTYIPLEAFDGKVLQGLMRVLFHQQYEHTSMEAIRARVLAPFVLGVGIAVYSYFVGTRMSHLLGAFCATWLFIFSLVAYRKRMEIAHAAVMEEILRRRDALPETVKLARKKYGRMLGYGLAAGVSLVVALKVLKLLKDFYHDSQSESLLRPNGLDDIKKRDSLPCEWVDNSFGKLEKGTSTLDQIVKLTEKNIFFSEVHGAEHISKSLCCVLTNGVVAIPKHNLVEGYRMLKMSRGSWYVEIPLDDANVYKCPEKDIAFVYSAKIQGRDLIKHIRENDVNTSLMRMLPSKLVLISRLKETEEVCSQELYGTWSNVIKASEGSFPGWNYTMSTASYHGLCGAAVVVRDSGYFAFGGIHLAGNQRIGAGGSICQKDIDALREHFKNLPDIATGGPFPSAVIGDSEAIRLNVEPDKSSPLVWMGGTHHYEYLGQCKGKSTFQSNVRPSMISETVTKVTGHKNNYGPPRVGQWWRPYHLDLEKRSNQPIGFGIGELNAARSEYVSTFVSEFYSLDKSVRDYLTKGPLSNNNILKGIPEYRFIDRMNFKSALGFPYTGSKKKFCTLDDNGDIIDFLPWIWDEVKKVETVMKHAVRSYQPFKTSLKDEITKQFKDDGSENTKVRVFTCAPVTLQILIRKYYLPVAAALSHLPLTSEQAVGINASGPDFHELIEHIKVYGDQTGFVAGDFSKYDLGMSADAILAAFAAMRDIAKELLHYSEEDIGMMDMIANEVANPVLAYNGDAIVMTGSNPSGQNMTVYVNGIVNSLYHRCVFNRLKKEHNFSGTFSEKCRATFYGDDSLFSPHPDVAEFVHFNSLARIFKDVGIGYTPADKSASAPDLISLKEIDFLKRKPVFNEHIGMYMGALDVGSMMKSLHCNATDTLPPDMAAAVNLDGSIREMFNHGEEPYERWRAQVRQIADEHSIGPLVLNLDVCYRQYLERYKAKYL